jgi:hypothetical protein
MTSNLLMLLSERLDWRLAIGVNVRQKYIMHLIKMELLRRIFLLLYAFIRSNNSRMHKIIL